MPNFDLLKEKLEKATDALSLNALCEEVLNEISTFPPTELTIEKTDRLAITFSFQVITLCNSFKLPQNAKNLLRFLLSKNLLRGNPLKVMKEHLEKSNEGGDGTREPSLNGTIRSIHDRRPDEELSKNFGVSFLNMNGDFIFMDEISKKLLEVKQKNNSPMNLFDLMIPFSRKVLNKNFPNGEMFWRDKRAGATTCFSFVIYSETARAKFEKTLKQKQIGPDDVTFSNADEKEKFLYYSYMRSLSSKATLINMNFEKINYADFEDKSTQNLFFISTLQKLMADPEPQNSNGFRDMKVSSFYKNEEFNMIFKEDQNNLSQHQQRNRRDEKSQKLCRSVIMLETRRSKNPPKYPYPLMANDSKIFEMKSRILKKL